MVPVRLKDLYKGFELGACLDIVKELNAGCELDKAKIIHNGLCKLRNVKLTTEITLKHK